MTMRVLGALACLGLIVVGVERFEAQAQERPLVSTFNGSFAVFAGWSQLPSTQKERYWGGFVGGQEIPPFVCDQALACFVQTEGRKPIEGFAAGGEFRVSLPIGQRFGLQADVAAGVLDSLPNGNFRGHAFVGAPDFGTFGALFQAGWLDNASFRRAGAEAQLWLGPVSLYGTGGHQWGDGNNRIEVDSGIFACGEARWYPTENALIGVGADWTKRHGAAFANAELQLSGEFSPISLFAQAGVGESRFRTAVAGARWNFGPGRTLYARHRQDMLLPYAACGLQQFRSISVRNSVVAVE